MKMKLFLAALLLIMAVNTKSAPVPASVATQIMYSLQKQFPGAQFAKVQEIEGENLYTVRMVYRGEGMMAYTYASGELVAVARSFTAERLPFFAYEKLNTSFRNYELRQLEELTLKEETSYFASLENNRETLTVRFFADGTARIIKRVKK